MTEPMIEAEEISDKGLMIEIEGDILLSDRNPEVITIQVGHTEGHTITEIEVTADTQ